MTAPVKYANKSNTEYPKKSPLFQKVYKTKEDSSSEMLFSVRHSNKSKKYNAKIKYQVYLI